MQTTIHRRAVSWAIRLFSLTLATSSVAFGQAWVELDTPTNLLITNRVNGAVVDRINYYAEVLHGPASATDAELVRAASLFRPPGRVNAPGPDGLGNYQVGDRIRFLVRVWNHEGDRYKRFEDAVLRGSSTSWLSAPVISVLGDSNRISIKLDGMPLFSVGVHVDPSEIGHAVIPVGPPFSITSGILQTVTFHGLTANGRAAFYRKETFAGTPTGFATSISHELSDSIDSVLREFARQDKFAPFPDPNFPSEPTSTPAWTVPAMTSDGSVAIGNRQSGAVSNVFLIRTNGLVPLPLKSGLGLSGNGALAFGTLEDGAFARHRPQAGITERIIQPPPDNRVPRIVATSETGNALLIGLASPTGELMQYWHAWEGLKQLPPTSVFLPVCLSPDGLTLGGNMKTNGHTVAARWTVARGVERIGPLDRESSIGGLSFDGSILAGQTWLSASSSETEPMLWMADGTAHRVRDLLPRFARSAVDARNVFGVSHDGRAIGLHNGIECHILRLNLPGERFAIDLRQSVESPTPILGFHTLRGVGYTIERQLPDGPWTVASPETEGLDAWREWIPDTTDDHGLFRVTARSL
jgi:hypothetical protein